MVTKRILWYGSGLVVCATMLCMTTAAADINHVAKKAAGRRGRLFPVLVDGRVGYITAGGEVAIAASFGRMDAIFGQTVAPGARTHMFWARDFSEGVAAVNDDGRIAYIRRDGSFLTEMRFSRAGDFEEGMAEVAIDGRVGVLGAGGRLLVPCEYVRVTRGGGAWLATREDGTWLLLARDGSALRRGGPSHVAYWDRSGVIEAVDKARWFWHGSLDDAVEYNTVLPPRVDGEPLPMRQGRRWGFLSWNGNVWRPATYTRVTPFDAGRAFVQQDGKWGVLGLGGAMIAQTEYEALARLEGGWVGFRSKGKWGVLDPAGGVAVPAAFDAIRSLGSGVVGCCADGKWGVLSRTGRELVPCKYDAVRPPGEGLVPVKEGRRWGYVGLDGRGSIPDKFDDAWPFHDGLAVVKVGETFGIIATDGTFRTEPALHHASFEGGVDDRWLAMSCGRARILVVGRGYGYVDASGRIVIEPQFGAASFFFDEGIARVNVGGHPEGVPAAPGDLLGPRWVFGARWGYIDRHGKWVWEPSK